MYWSWRPNAAAAAYERFIKSNRLQCSCFHVFFIPQWCPCPSSNKFGAVDKWIIKRTAVKTNTSLCTRPHSCWRTTTNDAAGQKKERVINLILIECNTFLMKKKSCSLFRANETMDKQRTTATEYTRIGRTFTIRHTEGKDEIQQQKRRTGHDTRTHGTSLYNFLCRVLFALIEWRMGNRFGDKLPLRRTNRTTTTKNARTLLN